MHDFKFNMETNLSNYVKPDSTIKRYPNISDQEAELINWDIFGDICISYSDILLTSAIDSTSNCINEYVWQFITSLHMQMPKLLKGDKVEQSFFDNPDTLVFIPEGKQIKIIFKCGCKNHKPWQELKVPISEVFSALLRVTKQLTDQLLFLNPKLGKSREVIALIKSYNETKNLLIKHGYNILSV
ncbi:MAG: hypothetical protein FIB08_03475 [Candidatus Methanoperedens sp.]|nr:hypothetical protein [Candidatus Methanoperedens sp.]